MICRFQAALSGGYRQPETFAKAAIHGELAARRHFAYQSVLLSKPFGDEPSPLHFRFQAALSGGYRQPEAAPRAPRSYGLLASRALALNVHGATWAFKRMALAQCFQAAYWLMQ
ncbi:hypothetical protein [Kingella sp. (in: b-proteobacteria)]|uniref:hypothetical protein n=1 Tax=Kingella sp. (in: b-proteobacteria) TaxID=2020713 RepID=UPI0026DC3942|nr:hypothetical protein [Kingella sp. (in: b-proteobacteria)]MDO4657454.1 hypothetical protein [Kingella sp. (in: b-proteobacteria)]